MKQNINYLKIVKIGLGAGMAMILAESLGLNYGASAGVITLLSIMDTKKETMRIMWRRMVSFLISLVLSAACFALFGYGALSVVVFLLVFSAVCIRFGMQEGISVNTVLMTHFLTEQSMSAANIGNECLLLIIGGGMGVLLNLYIPGKKKQIIGSQRQIEEGMRKILHGMAVALSGEGNRCIQAENLDELNQELDKGERAAYEDLNNNLLTETRYYLRYMNMRKAQTLVLHRIERNICQLQTLPSQAVFLSELLSHIGTSFHEYNNASGLLVELAEVKAGMRSQPLPLEREEFENRAVLFQVLLELEQFLSLKKDFVDELSEEEIIGFWKEA